MRHPTLKSSKKRAWDALSKCVRYAHAYDGINAMCVSCNTDSPWKDMDCGHWLAKKKGTGVYFCVDNLAPQHKRCNMQEGGGGGYALWMLKNRGEGVMQRIIDLGYETVIYKSHDYLCMEDHYKAELKRLQERRAAGASGILEFKAYG